MENSNVFARLVPALIVLLAGCGGGNGGGNQNPPGLPGPPQPAAVRTQQVFAGVALTEPTALRQAPNDATRWFALGKAGLITVFDNDPVNAAGSPFLNISARVLNSGEAGLLGMAFHPDFANNGEVYVSYVAPGLVSVISRFQSFDGNQTLDPMSEQILLTVGQPAANHNGGDLHFGPDGYLYVSFGDGGGSGDPQGNGQNTASLPGSMIRIDVDIAAGYDIPPTNPFAGNPPCVQGYGGANCPEIYAWGFRNPWRFSFDSATGELWVGDVGQGTWEEVDRVELGENYGWNTREGAHCFSPSSGCTTTGLTDPISEYNHSLGNSITGGYVYHGTAIPALQGDYIFGDFGSGRLWSVPANSPIGTSPSEIADTTHSISAFAEGADGELFVVDFGGSIHQIIP
jgi:glucose/arabinose dehydrogenase